MILADPNEWHPAELAQRTDWIHPFRASEIEEIERALAAVTERGQSLDTLTRDDFELPTLAPRLSQCLEYLENQTGIYLFRGFPVERFLAQEMRLLFWGLGLHLGVARPQGKEGQLLGDVRDMQGQKGARGYKTNAYSAPHSDSCDVLGLFVLRGARSGGEALFSSSVAIHNEIARTRPDLLQLLYEPFYVSWKGELGQDGKPYFTMPVFCRREGKLASRYNSGRIRAAYDLKMVPTITKAQKEALDLVDTLARSERFAFVRKYEAGDLVFVNNHTTYHGRLAFEDHDEPTERRHLLRIWLSVPNSRPLSPLMGAIYADPRGGAVRGGYST